MTLKLLADLLFLAGSLLLTAGTIIMFWMNHR